MDDQERKNSRTGIFTSVGIHAALFLIFFFMMAWRAPNPPLPEYGIELNFGLDSQGSGDVQPETPVGDESDQQAEEQVEQAAEAQPEKVKQEKVDEAAPEKPIDQAISKTESPVVVKEEIKEVKPEILKKPVASNPKEKIVAEYKKDNKKEVNPVDASKKGNPGSQGDDSKKVGDKGSPEGTLDAKALYGTPGGGGGGSGMDLQMAGWAWADQPKMPDLPDNENGKVVFEIECDENGDITGINTLERSLSPRAEKILREEIQKNSLIRTSGARAPERSRGKIVFILRTK